jgi:hypothetical protein
MKRQRMMNPAEWFVSGHRFGGAAQDSEMGFGFTGCGKSRIAAAAPEGAIDNSALTLCLKA